MRPARHGLILSLALGLGCLSAAGSAQQQDVAVGSKGELFAVRVGTYGDLFPTAPAAANGHAPGDRVLALDILRPGNSPQRLLVPNWDAPGAPSSASVLVERSTGAVFVVWRAEIDLKPVLYLTSFDGANWSQRIQVLGNPWAAKGAPQIAVTHNTYRDVRANGSPITRNRTIIHMVWAEQDTTSYEAFYRPFIIEDGSYLGWVSAIRLKDLDPSPPVTSAAVSPALAMAPSIQPGRDQRTVVVTFASPESGRVISMEIDALPEELRHSADQARGSMVDIGRKISLSQGTRGFFAAQVRSTVISAAIAFHYQVAQSLADQVASFVAASSTADLATLADQTRDFLLNMGANFAERGLKLEAAQGDPGSSTAPAPSAAQIIEMQPVLDASPSTHAAQLFQFRLASSRPAPVLPATLPATAAGVQLYASRTGADILVAWPTMPDGSSVSYEESTGLGWSELRQLPLGSGIDLQRALGILAQHVRD
ncbi:MAG TPA: hypothetical protein VHR45_04065 [Thermoanaerobaculia bacterium]|nr:hypothetical protein [Thermoanaerobaculia bacterium]